MRNHDRPPIGVMPEWLALERRAQDLNAAIERYLAAGKPPLPEWGDEIGRISRRLLEIQREKDAKRGRT